MTGPTERMEGRKGKVDMESNCRAENKNWRHRKEFVTHVRVFAKIYNLQRDIMTASEVAVTGWGATQYTELRKFRLLTFDLKVRLSAISREEFFPEQEGKERRTPREGFSLSLYNVTSKVKVWLTFTAASQ